MSLEQFTEAQFNNIYDLIYKTLINNKVKCTIPQAYILGGQPGAGKTTLCEIFNRKLNYNSIFINGDEFRQYHPNYKSIQKNYGIEAADYTQPFANKIVEKLINQISSEKYNLIIEGTLRTADIPIKTCMNLKEKGYKVELSVIGVNPILSFKSTQLRYNKMKSLGMNPRATTKEHHDQVVKAINRNISIIYSSAIFDNISIYKRDRTCIYDQVTLPDLNPSLILNKIINGSELSIDEKQNIFHIDKSNNNQINVFENQENYYEFKDVLKNKLNLQDENLLRSAEKEIISIKLLGIDSLNKDPLYDINYLKEIHKYIFEDLYDWAGKIRNFPVKRSEKIIGDDTIEFENPKNILMESEKSFTKLNNIKWEELNKDEKAKTISETISEIWRIRPLINGNTICLMIFISHFSEAHGFPLDYQLFKNNANYLRDALVKAADVIFPDHSYLKKIMIDSINIGEELNIIQEITIAGFKPTKILIDCMKNLNQTFNKLLTVKELKHYSKNISTLSESEKKAVELSVKEFVNEEKSAMKDKIIKNNYPER